MPDYKKLCAELVEKLDELNCRYNVPNQSAIIERAHAALAESETEGPTDDELNALWNCCGIADEYGHHEGNFFDFARAVLARWGE